MKTNKRIVLIFLSIIVVLSFVSIRNNILSFQYSSSEQCFSSKYNADKTLFNYENDNNGFSNFSSKGVLFISYYKKNSIFGKTKYKRVFIKSIVPETSFNQWTKISDDLFVRYVKYENDIEKIESGDYFYEGSQIEYVNGNGENDYFWVYVIDTSNEKNKKANKNSFTNYRTFHYRKSWQI